MNSKEIRKGNLLNLATILSNQNETIDSKQCKLLSACFDILSKDELNSFDSIEIDDLIAEGNFDVSLPF